MLGSNKKEDNKKQVEDQVVDTERKSSFQRTTQTGEQTHKSVQPVVDSGSFIDKIKPTSIVDEKDPNATGSNQDVKLVKAETPIISADIDSKRDLGKLVDTNSELFSDTKKTAFDFVADEDDRLPGNNFDISDPIGMKEFEADDPFEIIGHEGVYSDIGEIKSFAPKAYDMIYSTITLTKSVVDNGEFKMGEAVQQSPGSKSSQYIANKLIGIMTYFVRSLTLYTIDKTKSVFDRTTDTVSNIFGNRKFIKNDRSYGNPFLCAAGLNEPSRSEMIQDVIDNESDDSTMSLGITKLQSAGNGASSYQILDIMSPLFAFVSQRVSAIATGFNTTQNIINPMIAAMNPYGQSGYINRMLNTETSEYYKELSVSRYGLNMQQYLLNMSKGMQDKCILIARKMFSMTGFKIKEEYTKEAETVLSGNGIFTELLSYVLKPLSDSYISDMSYAELAPNLFRIDGSEYDDLSSGQHIASIPVIMDILSLYTLCPSLAHRLDHKLIPFIMSQVRGTQFGEKYFATNRYSRSNVNPKFLDEVEFYSDDNYPHILQADTPLQHPLNSLKLILTDRGEVVNASREWLGRDLNIYSGVAFGDFSTADNQLMVRINALRTFMNALVKESNKTLRLKEHSVIEHSKQISSLTEKMSDRSTELIYSLGYHKKMIASSFLVNSNNVFNSASSQNDTSIIHGDGKIKVGRRRYFKIKRGSAFKILLAGGSDHIAPTGGVIAKMTIDPENMRELIDMMMSVWCDSEKAGIAVMMTHFFSEYFNKPIIEAAASVNLDDGTIDWVPTIIKTLSTGDASFQTSFVDSYDSLTRLVNLSSFYNQKIKTTKMFQIIVDGINKVYPTMYSDLLDDGKGDSMIEPMTMKPRYEIYSYRNVNEPSYISPELELFNPEYATVLGSIFSYYFNRNSSANSDVSNFCITRVQETSVDLFGVNENSFDYDDFMKKGSYNKHDVEHKYIRANLCFGDSNLDEGSHPDYPCTHYAIIGPHGGKSRGFGYLNSESNTYLLLIKAIGDDGPFEPVDFKKVNLILNIENPEIVGLLESNYMLIKAYLERYQSQDSYPGKFVIHDYVTSVSFDLRSLSEVTDRHKEDELTVENYIKEHPRWKVNSFVDHQTVANMRINVGASTTSTFHFINKKLYEKNILAIRPNMGFGEIINTEGTSVLIKDYKKLHVPFAVNKFKCQKEGGEIVYGDRSGIVSLISGNDIYCHAITAFDGSKTKNYSDLQLITTN